MPDIDTAGRWTRCPGSRGLPYAPPPGLLDALRVAAGGAPEGASSESLEFGAEFGRVARERGLSLAFTGVAVAPHPGVSGPVHAWGETAGYLQIMRLEWGHRPVEVAKNPALILQALALASATTRRAQFHLYQPRAQHRHGVWRQWEMDAGALPAWRDLFVKTLAAPPDVLHAGTHCAGCPGRAACPALAQAAGAALEVSETTPPGRLDDLALGRELAILADAEAMLRERRDALEAEASARIDAGAFVPGWGLEATTGRTVFRDPAQVEVLAALYGLDPTQRELVSPAEMRRRFKAAGLDPSILGAYTHRPPGAAKLVRLEAPLPLDDIPY